MTEDSPLTDKLILIVDDEPDILATLEDELDMCRIHKATDFDTAFQNLARHTYDAVILDIMGVKGFELLKNAVSRGFPTIMLTAHALTPDALKKSIQLGAVSFFPKEKMSELMPFLEDVVTYGGAPAWQRTFKSMGGYFDKRFGHDWHTKDKFFKQLMQELEESSRD